MEEMRNENWEAITPPENSRQEMENIRKTIKKQNLKTILTSIVLGIVLLFVTVYGIMPLVEKGYWSPYDATLDQYQTDLDLVLQVYTELFLPGKSVSVVPGKTGFAEYELHMTLMDTVKGTKDHFMGSLVKGRLGFDQEFFEDETVGLFRCVLFPDSYAEEWLIQENEAVREKLLQLPEYVTLKAEITYPEDLTMAQLLTTMEYDYIGSNGDLTIIWAAIRTQEPEPEDLHRTVGISFTRSYSDGGINDLYPQLELTHYEPTGSTLEQHFISLLKFASDQMEEGKAVVFSNRFYQEALSYVEENGVKAYGSIVTGNPQTLLALLDSGDILDMRLLDAWIDVE